MENSQINNKDRYTIDVVRILRMLWHRAWIIILAGVIVAAAGFSVATFLIRPQYSSSILLYVNNGSIDIGGGSFSITASDISASQSLVKTYTEILNNRTTYEKVIEKAGLSYTWEDIEKMVEAGQSNDTEIMKVTVTTFDPYESAKIANCIAEILPERISEVIEDATMEVVDSAIPNTKKVSPSITNFTIIGMILGALISACIIAVMTVMDDTIHDEEYVIQSYNYPILAKVPNLLHAPSKGYGYRYQKYRQYKNYSYTKEK